MPQRAIIVGGGSVGSRVASILGDYGHDPVIVEQDADRCDQFRTSRHGQVIHGDATRRELLDQADPARADVFAALTGTAETNHALCRRVKARPATIRTIARGKPPGTTLEAADAVDETVHPAVAGAKAVVSALLGDDHKVRTLPTTEFDFVEFGVDPRAPAAGRTVQTVRFPSGSRVIADTESMSVAGPETELRPDRRYLVAVEPGAADTVRNLFRGVR